MAGTNRGKVGAVKSLLKGNAVQVLLDDEEFRALERAVAKERKARRTVRGVSRGSLLRETAMPRILEIARASE